VNASGLMNGSGVVSGNESASARLWSNRRTLGAVRSQTGAPAGGIVRAVGGGFIPTLESGGGAGVLRPPRFFGGERT
jgi:hypothetical protein